MKSTYPWLGAVAIGAMITLLSMAPAANAQTDPLPSWNDGPARQAIVDFVQATTTNGSSTFVPPAERIATFDQDGTLWVEHPMYTQVMYCFDRCRRGREGEAGTRKCRAVQDGAVRRPRGHRETLDERPRNDPCGDPHRHDDGTIQADVKRWLAMAKDPRWKRPYTELTYQPMQEVLKFLRANGFKTYIVTGGGQDFVRVYAEQTYGIPPEQVVGTAGGTKYGYDQDGKPILTKEPKLLLNDDNAGKPEGIHLMIGRRPYAAFGNSTGDRQMLEYTKAGDGARLAMLVLHDDADARVRLRPGARIARHQGRHFHAGALR